MRWTETGIEFDSKTWWRMPSDVLLELYEEWGVQLKLDMRRDVWSYTVKRTPEFERYITMLALAGHL